MSEGPSQSVRAQHAVSNDADVALMERIVAGDRAAFEQLYHKYYHPLLRFLCRITGEVDSAQEGVNDVMVVVWRNGARFGGRSKVSTWLMGIAYRKGLRLVEKNRRWLDRFKGLDLGEHNEPLGDGEAPTQQRELEDLLEHGMRRLSAKQRAVVELTYFYGYSYEEIAAIVECPVNTVKTRMLHARAKLRRALPALEKGSPPE